MNLFFREFGTGFPIVILHGLYGSSDNWVTFGRIMAQKHRVILVDQRNHGHSPHTGTHTYPEMVNDLAWLLDELGIGQTHLLGHSMGGKVAMLFASDYPEKTASLTIADIAPVDYLENPASALQYQYHKKILDTLYQLDLSAFSARSQVEEALLSELAEPGLCKFLMKNLARHHQDPFFWKINVPVLRTALPHIISGAAFSEFEDRIPITRYPVHFIKGALSAYIGSDQLETIRLIYPEALITEIQGAGHLVHAEKPNEFIQAVQLRLL